MANKALYDQDQTNTFPQTPRGAPSDMDAERAVLGSIMIDPDVMVEVQKIIGARDFYRERHSWLFSALQTLYNNGEPLEFVFVCHELNRMGRLEDLGGAAYITDLVSMTPTAMFAVHYATIVEKTARLRRLIAFAGNLAEAAYQNDADASEIVSRMTGALEIEGRKRLLQKPDTTLTEHLTAEMHQMGRYLEAQARGEQLGLHFGWRLDETIGGLQAGNVMVVAARPGVGKTSLTLCMAMRFAQQGHAGAFFSLEMSGSEIIKKIVANYSGVDSVKLRNYDVSQDEIDAIMGVTSDIARLPLLVIDSACDTIASLRRHVSEMVSTHRIKWIAVDYIQLMNVAREENASAAGDNRQGAVEYIAQGLKTLARDFGIVVIAVSQLNRGLEYRADKRPMLADLRSSGAIEQSGDCVVFLYRDDTYTQSTESSSIAEINVSKNRHGRTGITKMRFDLARNRFEDVAVERVELSDYGIATPTPAPTRSLPIPKAHFTQVTAWTDD